MRVHVIALAAVAAVTLTASAPAAQVWWSPLDGNADAIVGTSGTPAGSPMPTADKNGNPGGAVQFNGTSDLFTIPKQVATFTSGSFSFWVRTDDLSGERGAVAVGASGGGTDQYFSIQNTTGGTGGVNNGKWRVDVDDGANRRDVLSDAAAPTGAWQHLVATFVSQQDMRLYVDGVLQSEVQTLAADLPSLTPTHDWLIGAERPTERFFAGAIDDVRIYDNALSQEDVTAIFTAGPTFIPEPSACGVLALACLALGARRRRRSPRA